MFSGSFHRRPCFVVSPYWLWLFQLSYWQFFHCFSSTSAVFCNINTNVSMKMTSIWLTTAPTPDTEPCACAAISTTSGQGAAAIVVYAATDITTSAILKAVVHLCISCLLFWSNSIPSEIFRYWLLLILATNEIWSNFVPISLVDKTLHVYHMVFCYSIMQNVNLRIIYEYDIIFFLYNLYFQINITTIMSMFL